MNCWGVNPSIFPLLENFLLAFFSKPQPSDAECYLPQAISDLVTQNRITCEVSPTCSNWFGLTYPEDKALVQNQLKQLTQKKVYPTPLF